jgi:PAS domain S-box-containing protein
LKEVTLTKQKAAEQFIPMDAVPMPMIVIDAKGIVRHVNQATIDLLEYAHKEIVNTALASLMVEKKSTADSESFGNFIKQKQKSHYHATFISKSSKEISCVLHTTWIQTDQLITLALEVLPKEKAVNNEVDLLYASAFKHSFFGKAITNDDGIILRINHRLCEILGYPEAHMLGLNIRQFAADSNDLPFDTARKGDQKDICVESRFRDRSGEFVWAVVHIRSVRSDHDPLYFIVQIEDVTERKRLERRLLNETNWFSEMFHSAPVIMCVMRGPEHVFENANDLYLKFSGRSNVVGKKVREVFPEAEGQGIFEIMDRVFKTGEVYTTRERHLQLDIEHRDGKLSDTYLDFMFQPARNQEGKVDGIFFFGVDVTEQVSARREIEQSEMRYRQIVELAQEGIWLLDENDITIFGNKKLADIFECPVEELAGQPFYNFVEPGTFEAAHALFKSHRQFSSNTAELELRSKSGKMIWATIRSVSLVDQQGDYKGCLAMVTDITENKRVADELFKLSLIAKHTVNVVYIINTDEKIDWINESFVRTTGYAQEEVTGRTEDFLYGPLTDPKVKSQIKQSRKNLEPYDCELIKYTRLGSTLWVKHRGQPIFNQDGRLSHFFVMETDITERKNAFEKLKAAENEVRMFAMQLNTILESERLRIAREIHDELGQQLTGLKMLLGSLPTDETSAGTKKIIAEMKQSVDAAKASIRNLATELRPGIIDTLGLVPSIDWLAKTFEAKTNIKCFISMRVVDQKFEEKISMTFFRICQEALNNIVKHAQATTVYIQLIQTRDSLSLKIADNGTGISTDNLKDPFSMGLLGMRERAKLIDARFSVEANSPTGTTLFLICKLHDK